MLFNSHAFLWLFLPIVLSVSMYLRGNALLFWITASSFVFYSFAGHLWFLVPMLVTTVVDFLVAPFIERAESKPHKRALLLVSLCSNVGLLAYFKYGGLFANTVKDLFDVDNDFIRA